MTLEEKEVGEEGEVEENSSASSGDAERLRWVGEVEDDRSGPGEAIRSRVALSRPLLDRSRLIVTVVVCISVGVVLSRWWCSCCCCCCCCSSSVRMGAKYWRACGWWCDRGDALCDDDAPGGGESGVKLWWRWWRGDGDGDGDDEWPPAM